MKMKFILSVLVLLSASLAHGDQILRCLAGIQPDLQKNSYTSEKKPEDFKTIETSIVRYGKTYSVRKYQLELENFIVEGILYLESGVAAELSITDQTTGAIARIQEHGQVRMTMSSLRGGELTHIFAACSEQW